jgi:hypothetical protein
MSPSTYDPDVVVVDDAVSQSSDAVVVDDVVDALELLDPLFDLGDFALGGGGW